MRDLICTVPEKLHMLVCNATFDVFLVLQKVDISRRHPTSQHAHAVRGQDKSGRGRGGQQDNQQKDATSFANRRNPNTLNTRLH
eukprot:3668594-Rhodomonas_salina.1